VAARLADGYGHHPAATGPLDRIPRSAAGPEPQLAEVALARVGALGCGTADVLGRHHYRVALGATVGPDNGASEHLQFHWVRCQASCSFACWVALASLSASAVLTARAARVPCKGCVRRALAEDERRGP
jgi:hypothetical protein